MASSPTGAPVLNTPTRSAWQRGSAGAVALFHRYANWLVSITWKRFFALSLLLAIAALLLGNLAKAMSAQQPA